MRRVPLIAVAFALAGGVAAGPAGAVSAYRVTGSIIYSYHADGVMFGMTPLHADGAFTWTIDSSVTGSVINTGITLTGALFDTALTVTCSGNPPGRTVTVHWLPAGIANPASVLSINWIGPQDAATGFSRLEISDGGTMRIGGTTLNNSSCMAEPSIPYFDNARSWLQSPYHGAREVVVDEGQVAPATATPTGFRVSGNQHLTHTTPDSVVHETIFIYDLEVVRIPGCRDGIDNDLNGTVDYPADANCSSPDDPLEDRDTECSDGLDNDGDGLAGWPADPGCSSVYDFSELGEVDCDDGLDDDADGAVDTRDVGCAGGPTDTSELDAQIEWEMPPRYDGSDRNGDGFVDSFTGTQPVIFQPVQHKPPYTKRELDRPRLLACAPRGQGRLRAGPHRRVDRRRGRHDQRRVRAGGGAARRRQDPQRVAAAGRADRGHRAGSRP